MQKWLYLRKSQLAALSLRKTGTPPAVDIGLPDNVHPLAKAVVGNRLALAVQKVAYGEDVVRSGSTLEFDAGRDQSVMITLTQEGSGLKIIQAPWIPLGAQPLPTNKLVGFDTVETDRKFVPADAGIEEKFVTVSSGAVMNSITVRYAWNNEPADNLHNVENLPASPLAPTMCLTLK